MNINSSDPAGERIGIATVVYAFYCALLPLNMILNFTGFTINKYIGILSAAFFLFDIVRWHKTKLNRVYAIYLVFLLWGWITLTWSVNAERSMSQLITLSSLVFITVFGLLRGFNDREIKLLKYSMILPAAAIVFYLAPNFSVSYTRATLQSSAGSADHNSLAANILFPLMICINEIKYERKRWLKIVNIMCLASMVISLLLIASRGSFLAAIVALIAYFGFERHDEGKSIRVSTLLRRILIVLLVVLVGYVILRNVSLPALSRLKWDQLFTNSGYGRTNLWTAAWKALWDSVLRVFFGYGYGTEPYITYIYTGRMAGIHNVYLEHWCTTGIIGLILLLMVFIRPLVFARKHKDNLSVALVIALMIVCVPLGFLTNKGAWNILLLAFVGLQNHKNCDEDIE